MKIKIFNPEGKETKTIELPKQFDEPFRPDLVKRAFLAYQSNNRQNYGTDVKAGMRYSAEVSRRREEYRGSYGQGISRSRRKVLTRRGRRFYWIGAFSPGTVGGRKAHPPKAAKNWKQEMNKKERRKAIRSALAATLSKDLVSKKHKLPEAFPFALSNEYESIKKTAELRNSLLKLGLAEELERCSKKKIRAGKGKNRNRPYEKKRGPLFVVSDKCSMVNAVKNIPGFDIADVKHLNIALLAPDGKGGRLVFFTEKALNTLKEENLFE